MIYHVHMWKGAVQCEIALRAFSALWCWTGCVQHWSGLTFSGLFAFEAFQRRGKTRKASCLICLVVDCFLKMSDQSIGLKNQSIHFRNDAASEVNKRLITWLCAGIGWDQLPCFCPWDVFQCDWILRRVWPINRDIDSVLERVML